MAPEGEGKPEADLGGGLCASFLLEAFGEGAGLFEHEGVVAEDECLQGRGGDQALGREVGRVGTIQGCEELVRGGADHKAVDASSPQFRDIQSEVHSP